VLVLDANGSMTRATDGVRAAALSFVEALRPEDALSVLLFSDGSAFAHGLTTDRQQSMSAINAYHARGGTALYDGLTDSLTRLKQTEGRKVVVLLSDGRDENNAGTGPGSARTRNDVFAASRETNATIYPIGLGSHVDRELRERLAAESGGAAYFPRMSQTYATTREDRGESAPPPLVSYTSTNSHVGGGRLRSRLAAELPSGAGAAIPRRNGKERRR
jgi:Mg-chelatase subunit ChlD